MTYAGFYINMDRNPERRVEMEAELARYGLSHLYTRFPAAAGNALGFPNRGLRVGEMGCFTSHYLLLKENLAQDRHLHIVEDDILFASCTDQAIRWTLAQDFMSKYDIIFTDVFIPLQNSAYIAYKKFYDKTITRDANGNITRAVFTVIDMQDITFASTCSMLVNKASIKKLHDIYEEELKRGPQKPVDLFLQKKSQEGVIRVGCLFPFITSIRLDRIMNSDIETERQLDPLLALAVNIARHSFFIGCNWDDCQSYIDKYLPLPKNDKHRAILGHLLAFSLIEA